MNVGDTIKIASKEQLETVKGEVLTSANSGLSTQFAQHGLVPNDNVNEIRPDDMFEEVDVPDVLVDKKGYPVRFTDGVYDRLGEELIPDAANIHYNSENSCFDFSINGTAGQTYLFTNSNPDTSARIDIEYSSGSDNQYYGNTSKFIFTMEDGASGLVQVFALGNTGTIGKLSVKELPQFQLPKAPFATGSTDELLDDKVNGLTTQSAHSKGDIVVVCGNELVTNGTFDNDTSGWTATNSTISSVNSQLEITGTDAYNSASQFIPTEVGSTYICSGILMSGGNGLSIIAGGVRSEMDKTGLVSVEFTATSTTTEIKLYADVQSTIIADNVSVKLKDQSYIATKDVEAGQVIDAGEWDTRQSYATDVLVKNNNKVYKCVQSYTANDMWDTTSSYVTDNLVEYSGKVYKALQDADDTIEIDNTDYWEYQRDTVEINSTDYWEYQYDLGFKPIPYVTKQVALLIEKTNDGVINNIALPLVNMYGEESIETYEQDIFNELGFSQKADRVYTDGSSEYILLGLKGYLC